MFAIGPAFFGRASAPATLALTGTFPAATVGAAYSSSIAISGGIEPYALTGGTGISAGSLDSGFSLAITGTAGARLLTLTCASPATADTMTFTASVGSTDGQTATSAQSVVVSASTNWYSPIFAAGGSGMVFDFGDMSSMYQDTAHTIPVTSVGQTVKAVQCKITGAWLTSSSGSVLSYDSTRGKNKLTFASGARWTTTAISGLLGTVDRTLTAICTPASAHNNFMISIGAAGSGTYIYVANDSAGFATGTNGSGGAARTGTQTGFGVFSGWVPATGTNRGRVYRGGTDLGHSDSLNAAINVVSSDMYVGDYPTAGLGNFIGDFFGALIINRLLTTTELSSIASAFP